MAFMPASTATAAFKRAMGRAPQRIPYGTVPVTNNKPLDAGALYHYWYPGRDGVEPCPKAFAKELHRVHADLGICRPPAGAPTVSHPWLVWYRKASITHWLSPGWMLLFVWQTKDLEPLPLDNRVFANLYTISAMQFGSASAYFDSVVETMRKDKARVRAKDKADTDAQKREFMQSRKIKNIGKGNKFALHHDGGIVPSRGEANWSAELERERMPGELKKKLDDKRKQILSRRKDRG